MRGKLKNLLVSDRFGQRSVSFWEPINLALIVKEVVESYKNFY